MSWPVKALCRGTIAEFVPGRHSAIGKQAVSGAIAITPLGLEGDQQADKASHGGPDMAVHLYPLDHHAYWRDQIGNHNLLAQPGAFGTNIAVDGLAEDDVLLGDRFRLGSALLEACQPRQPCAKIEHYFGCQGMVAKILQTGRCGWFFRVIEPGQAQAGDMLERAGRGDAQWSMARMFATLWKTGKIDREADRRALQRHALLPDKMHGKIARMLGES